LLDQSVLKDFLHQKAVSRKDKLLLLLASNGTAPMTVAEIRTMGIALGLRAVKDWNVSAVLSGGQTLAIRGKSGWELSTNGKKRVEALTGISLTAPIAKAAVDLRAHLTMIKSPDTVAFLSEAITCLEQNLLRAAVVLSWVGAISLLYSYVIARELPAFNAEAARRDSKWKPAKTGDDLARMKEHEFLNVLEAISVIGKNMKQELQTSLSLRNACGHPNSLKIGANRVASHIEILILNVFQKF
jgi:hypothetical protein